MLYEQLCKKELHLQDIIRFKCINNKYKPEISEVQKNLKGDVDDSENVAQDNAEINN